MSKFDQSVFMKDGIYLTVYINDILIFRANEEVITIVKESLSSEFKITNLRLYTYYLSMEIQQEANSDVLIH